MLNPAEVSQIGFLILEGESLRQITREFKIGDRSVSRMKMAMEKQEFDPAKWMQLSDNEKMRICYPSAVKKVTSEGSIETVFERIYQRINHRSGHYSIRAGWLAYKKENHEGLQYSRFHDLYRKWEDAAHPGRTATAPVFRQPGKYLFIDWIGDQPALVRSPKNPAQKIKAHILVFTMGYSSLTFAMAFPDEKTAAVIEGINGALDYMGALPRAFRPDNMKTAVTSNTKDGLVLSTAMEDLQNYYEVPVLPTRPLKPKDKASVERAVLILEQELLPQLETKVFESFEDLNEEILIYIQELNTRIKTGETLSRRQLFEKYDLPNMKPLPPHPFVLREYKRLKVQRNCHIQLNRVYYSVPFEHVGKEVTVKISDQKIEICDENNKPICEHRTDISSRSPYVTNESHLKSCYQKQREIDVRGIHFYLDRAAKIGPFFTDFLKAVINRSPYEEQSYKTCEGIIRDAEPYSSSTVEEVAAECMKNGWIGYKKFKNALNKRADSRKKQPPESEEQKQSARNHSNIRGKEYYK